MRFNKFTSLGLVAVAIALNGCTPYREMDNNFQLASNQKGVSITLGDAFETGLYNVKEPIDVEFKAPEGQKIIIGKKEYPTYKVHINPQDSIHLKFELFKDGKKEPTIVETHVSTFKDVFKPSNRRVLEEKSGKYTNVVGYKHYYTVADGQKDVIVDLHEHNKLKKHNFYYLNANRDLTIKMIAPKYTSFVFQNGTSTKEYSFTMKAGEDIHFGMQLKQDNSNNTYERVYKFKRG